VDWVYDSAGNLRYRTNGGLVQTFSCDGVNQLTNVSRNSTMTVSGATPAPASSVTVNGQPAQTYGDFTFARTNVPLNDPNNTFTIIAENANALRVTNTINSYLPSTNYYLWDSNGNLTNDGTRVFSYSPENRLTNITVAGAWKNDFVFDGLGRRRIERDYAWSSAIGNWQLTNELQFLYDGWLLVQVRNSNNVPLESYTRGLDLSCSLSGAGGIGGLLARTDGAGTTFYHADGAGNITGLMDGQQNMAARYLYGASGILGGKWGPLADGNTMRFSSKRWDHLSDTYDFGFRQYVPNLGRWASQDPLGEAGGVNLYQFVWNDPLGWVDPDGWQPTAVGGPAMRTGPQQLELDLELREPAPIRWGPGRMPEEEIIRARESLMRRPAPAEMAIGASQVPLRPPTAREVLDHLREHPITEQMRPCTAAKGDTVLVRHYTDTATRQLINEGGQLNPRTYVTLPSEIPPRAGHLQIEQILEIEPGRGSTYIDVPTPASNLRVPANGPTTSGGAWQRQLIEPAPIDPTLWRRPPGRPPGGG